MSDKRMTDKRLAEIEAKARYCQSDAAAYWAHDDYIREADLALDHRDELLQALKAERQRNQWRPIESAPKDGTVIIGWRYHPVAIRYRPDLDADFPWDAVSLSGFLEFYFNGFEEGDSALTHWMPLRERPEKEQEQEDAPKCSHVWRNVSGRDWLKCMECGVVKDG